MLGRRVLMVALLGVLVLAGASRAGAQSVGRTLDEMLTQLHELNQRKVALVHQVVAELDGNAYLVGADGTYLGTLSSNSVDPDLITNTIGRYGSDISPTNILNDIGRFGSTISPDSAYNTIASDPPRIVIGRSVFAYLTKNSIKLNGLDPDEVLAALGRGAFPTVWLVDGDVAGVVGMDGARALLATSGCSLTPGELVVLIDSTIRESGSDRRCQFTVP
jgi:hypothetical protein